MSNYVNTGIIKSTVSSYLWEVKNFCNFIKNVEDCLLSPVFSTINSLTDKHKWCLHLYPKGERESYKDYISLFLKYEGHSSVEVNVSFSLLDDKNRKIMEISFLRKFEKWSLPYGYSKFIIQDFVKDIKNRILVDDTINIMCEIIYDSNLAVPLNTNCVEKHSPDYFRLREFDDFEKLLETENSTDVTIKIGRNEIGVHKAIVMSRSPVFQAMFKHDMKEKDQNVVEITDIEYGIMKEVIRFMYVGKVNELERIAADLLVAADKYSIRGLKVLSEKQLYEDLTVSNVFDCLKLADRSNSIELKSKIMEFIIRNQKEIIEKPELQLLPVEMVCEIFRAVVHDNLKK